MPCHQEFVLDPAGGGKAVTRGMRWLAFGILAVLFVVCQTTFVPRLEVAGTWPNWTFILAVHYALWGAWPEAAIAAWILGLAVDLQTASPYPIGLHAFCYGGAAWVILRIRQALFRDHPATYVGITFAFALAIQLLVGLWRLWRVPGEESGPDIFWPSLAIAIHTAVWSLPLHWILIKIGRFTGLRSRRGEFAPIRRDAT